MGMLDLYHASREELIRLVVAQREALAEQTALLARQHQQLVAQQAVNADLLQRVGELAAANRQLEQRVQVLEARPDNPGGLAGNKLIPDKPAKPKPSRKQRRHNVARRRMVPTAQVIHALSTCPDCGQVLGGGHVKRTREVIEVAFVPVTVSRNCSSSSGNQPCPPPITRQSARCAIW